MKPLRVVHAGVIPYGVATGWQNQLHEMRVEGKVPDLLLLLEHPHVYTLGRRFSKEHLLVDEKTLAERGIEVHEADRGGSITYHGPGQLVGYPILDLSRGSRGHPTEQPVDAIKYLRQLEEAVIRTVRAFGVIATRREGRTGVWVGNGKLAAIGVNVTRGVTKHGFAINVAPDLDYFTGIVPCGMPDAEPTSLQKLTGTAPELHDVAGAVATNLARVVHRVPIVGDLRDLGLVVPGVPVDDDVVSRPTVIDFPRRAKEKGRPPERGVGGREDAK